MVAATRTRTAAVLCACLLAGACLLPGPAHADEESPSLAQDIEATTKAYFQAADELADIEQRIQEQEGQAAEIEAKLPAQRERAAASIKQLYIFQQSSHSLLDLVLSSQSLDQFVATLHYMDSINQHNTRELQALTELEDQLVQTKARLEVDRDAAQKKKDEAGKALDAALAVRSDLQAEVVAIAQQETAAREEAVQAAREDVSAGNDTFETASGHTAQTEVAEEPSVSTEPLVTNTTPEESDDWASRINAYLEGSPLEGYGQVFADAAAQYGVDPRLSPAIATIESGKGSVCFRDYNAWGWGNSSWTDWESAIYDQVEGLATGYDGTLTLDGAQRYCPPNYQQWYSSVASQMESI